MRWASGWPDAAAYVTADRGGAAPGHARLSVSKAFPVAASVATGISSDTVSSRSGVRDDCHDRLERRLAHLMLATRDVVTRCWCPTRATDPYLRRDHRGADIRSVRMDGRVDFFAELERSIRESCPSRG